MSRVVRVSRVRKYFARSVVSGRNQEYVQESRSHRLVAVYTGRLRELANRVSAPIIVFPFISILLVCHAKHGGPKHIRMPDCFCSLA